MKDRERRRDILQALKWWETLDYDAKFDWFAKYCNRWTRNLEQIYDSEIEEIWVDNIKNSKQK